MEYIDLMEIEDFSTVLKEGDLIVHTGTGARQKSFYIKVKSVIEAAELIPLFACYKQHLKDAGFSIGFATSNLCEFANGRLKNWERDGKNIFNIIEDLDKGEG